MSQISQYDQEHLDDIMAGHGDWFTAQILRLCAKADRVNLERIRVGFPDEVAAFEEWRDFPPPRMDYDEARYDAGRY